MNRPLPVPRVTRAYQSSLHDISEHVDSRDHRSCPVYSTITGIGSHFAASSRGGMAQPVGVRVTRSARCGRARRPPHLSCAAFPAAAGRRGAGRALARLAAWPGSSNQCGCPLRRGVCPADVRCGVPRRRLHLWRRRQAERMRVCSGRFLKGCRSSSEGSMMQVTSVVDFAAHARLQCMALLAQGSPMSAGAHTAEPARPLSHARAAAQAAMLVKSTTPHVRQASGRKASTSAAAAKYVSAVRCDSSAIGASR
jgi:hypothetical protein